MPRISDEAKFLRDFAAGAVMTAASKDVAVNPAPLHLIAEFLQELLGKPVVTKGFGGYDTSAAREASYGAFGAGASSSWRTELDGGAGWTTANLGEEYLCASNGWHYYWEPVVNANAPYVHAPSPYSSGSFVGWDFVNNNNNVIMPSNEWLPTTNYKTSVTGVPPALASGHEPALTQALAQDRGVAWGLNWDLYAYAQETWETQPFTFSGGFYRHRWSTRAYYELGREPCDPDLEGTGGVVVIPGVPPEDDPNVRRPVAQHLDESPGNSKKRPKLPTMWEFPVWGVLPPLSGIQPRSGPRKGQKRDGKAKGRIYRIFKFLDRVSESAEVVDATFRALPCEIQIATMDNCRKKQKFLDAAGQYGIDQVDCKAAALLKHWDKVDAALAVSNIARNEVEDKAYGFVYKNLPKNVGNAPFAGGQAATKAQREKRDKFFDDLEGATPQEIAAAGQAPGVVPVNPLNDVVQGLVDGVSDALGLVPERKCRRQSRAKKR